MDNIKISIIIPCFNCRKYIALCIDSIIKQTYTNYEILIIDDGSTDGSAEIIRKYESAYCSLKYIYQTNSGPSAARNRGIKSAVGEYLMFVDADDYIGSQYLEHMVSGIREQCDMVIGGFTYRNKDTKKEMRSASFLLSKEEYYKHQYTNCIKNRTIFSPFNKLFRTQLLRKKSIYFDESIKIREDGLFVLNVIAESTIIAGVNSVDYYYIQHEKSESLITKYNPDEPKINEKFFTELLKPFEHEVFSNDFYFVVCIEFMEMEMASIAKFFMAKDKSNTKELDYIKKAVRNSNFIYARKKLLQIDWKKALRYYQPVLLIYLRYKF